MLKIDTIEYLIPVTVIHYLEYGNEGSYDNEECQIIDRFITKAHLNARDVANENGITAFHTVWSYPDDIDSKSFYWQHDLSHLGWLADSCVTIELVILGAGK